MVRVSWLNKIKDFVLNLLTLGYYGEVKRLKKQNKQLKQQLQQQEQEIKELKQSNERLKESYEALNKLLEIYKEKEEEQELKEDYAVIYLESYAKGQWETHELEIPTEELEDIFKMSQEEAYYYFRDYIGQRLPMKIKALGKEKEFE